MEQVGLRCDGCKRQYELVGEILVDMRFLSELDGWKYYPETMKDYCPHCLWDVGICVIGRPHSFK